MTAYTKKSDLCFLKIKVSKILNKIMLIFHNQCFTNRLIACDQMQCFKRKNSFLKQRQQSRSYQPCCTYNGNGIIFIFHIVCTKSNNSLNSTEYFTKPTISLDLISASNANQRSIKNGWVLTQLSICSSILVSVNVFA